jgi:ribonuclease Z
VGRVAFPSPVGVEVLPELERHVGEVTLKGTSVGARATALAVAKFGVALDLGRLTPTIAAQPVVLLSHAHLDHMSGILAYLNVRARFHPGRAPLVAVPAEVAPPLLEALAVMPGMESVRKRMAIADVIRGVAPGESLELATGSATAFAVSHTVPALGWALRRPDSSRPLLVYAGDGTTEPFAAAPALLDAQAAVVECSFVERNRRIAARLARHAHVLDWIDIAPSLTCDTLVLVHLPVLPRAELGRLVAPLASRLAGELVLWAGP